LDKIRESEDFTAEKLGMLVDALRQGTGLFGEAERERVVGGV